MCVCLLVCRRDVVTKADNSRVICFVKTPASPCVSPADPPTLVFWLLQTMVVQTLLSFHWNEYGILSPTGDYSGQDVPCIHITH